MPLVILIAAIILGLGTFFANKQLGKRDEKVQIVKVESSPIPTPAASFLIIPTPTPSPSPIPTPAFKLDSISPGSISMGGSLLLNGTSFGAIQGKVFFSGQGNETESQVVFWNNNQIQVTVPELYRGAYKIFVKKGEIASNSQTVQITLGKPKIESANPPNVAPYSGNITITGSDFGMTFGTVAFTDETGTIMGGSMINAWGDTSITIYNISVPKPNIDLFIQVVTDNRKSNLFPYHVGGS